MAVSLNTLNMAVSLNNEHSVFSHTISISKGSSIVSHSIHLNNSINLITFVSIICLGTSFHFDYTK